MSPTLRSPKGGAFMSHCTAWHDDQWPYAWAPMSRAILMPSPVLWRGAPAPPPAPLGPPQAGGPARVGPAPPPPPHPPPAAGAAPPADHATATTHSPPPPPTP